MASLNKSFHEKLDITWDIQTLKGLEYVQYLADEIAGWCTWDCYYVDCGYPCPEDCNCHLNLVKMCEELERVLQPEEDWAIEEYLESKGNI